MTVLLISFVFGKLLFGFSREVRVSWDTIMSVLIVGQASDIVN